MGPDLRTGHNGVPNRPPPPQRIPDEILGCFKTAISMGDWVTFDSYLSTFGPGKDLDIDDLNPVAFEAIRQDSATAIERLLCFGMTMCHSFVLEAIRTKAKRSLDIMVGSWDINMPRSETEPPVLASAVEDREMTCWLLDHGADLNKQTHIDLTPMSYAVRFAPPEFIKELLDHGGDVQKGELLQHALDRPADTIEVLRMLIDRGAPLNATMYERHEASRRLYPFLEFGTPLHKASEMDKADVVQFLLERQADPTVKNSEGRTALKCAIRSKSTETVKLLRSVSTG